MGCSVSVTNDEVFATSSVFSPPYNIRAQAMTSSQQRIRRNQFGEEVTGEDVVMTAEIWRARWTAGQTSFHKPCTHPMLEKHISLLEKENSQQKIFLPLCGKSVDLKWLADRGHVVIGNEYVELGCRQFFEENDLDYVISDIATIPGKMFKSTEEEVDITLYCCDFYKLTKDVIGLIDGIWDRGSLAAINRDDRRRYAQVMADLMSKDTRYLLDTFMVNNEKFAGPPHDIPIQELHTLFGDTCTLQLVEERDAMTDWQRSWGLDTFSEAVHLLHRNGMK